MTLRTVTLTMVGWVLAVPVRPSHGSGFAGNIVAAIVVLAVLMIIARWVSSKPRNRRK